MTTLVKTPSRAGPSKPSTTPDAFGRVFAIAELAERILQYSSRSGIGALRQTSWLFWNICTNVLPCTWFYKDVKTKFDDKYIEKDYSRNRDEGHNYMPRQWETNTARFVRSLEVKMPKKKKLSAEDLACLWKFCGMTLTQCPSLCELSFTRVMVRMPNWKRLILNKPNATEAHATIIARQVGVVAHRLKKLRLELAHQSYYSLDVDGEGESDSDDENKPRGSYTDEILLLEEDEREFFKWMESVDRILECIILSAGYMTVNITTPLVRHPFPCLQVLSLSGCTSGDIRVLEWDTLMACLHLMPILRELELIKIQLVMDSVGNFTDFYTIMDKRRAYTIHGGRRKSNPTFSHLRKLTLTEGHGQEIICKLDQAFPDIQALSASTPDVASPFCKFSPAGDDNSNVNDGCLHNDNQIPPGRSRLFPHLRSLGLVSKNNKETMNLRDVVLPRSLVDLQIEHTGSFSLPEDNALQAEPGTTLRHLCLKVKDDWIYQYIFLQGWCLHLTSLSLGNGVDVLRDLLPPEDEEDPWDYDHLDESFVVSKLPFLPRLRFLHLGKPDTFSKMPDSKAMFINRLLLFMPQLQEFSMDYTIERYQLLFYRLGRTHQVYPSKTSETPSTQDMVSGPSFKAINLRPVSSMNTRLAEMDLREQFPSLREIYWKDKAA
ncbi:hypothetical protein BGX31_008237 [Mortierella sp. GBA43]|nr:hypothetical protein BGX31_008237 [Mortierella sp. GBA43]